MATTPGIELAERTFAAFSRHDLEGFLANVDPDVVFLPLMRDADGDETVYRGHEAIRRYYASLFETFPDYAAEIEEAEEDGDKILLRARVTGTGAASGLPLDETVWVAAKRHDDLVHWWGFFRSREEAVAALG